MADYKKFALAIATLTSAIIGTGFFILPYIASQTGIWLTLGYFAALSFLVLLVNLMFADVALKTPDFLRLPGYAKLNLGKWGEKAGAISMVLGSYGTLLVYIIMGGTFLTNLLQPILGGDALIYTLIYYCLAVAFIYFGIKPLARIDFADLIAFSIVMVIVFFGGRQLWQTGNFLSPINLKNFFFPYGPILFALWGATMIPEIKEMLGRQKEKLLKKAVFISIVVSAVFYFLFIVLVSGISGPATTPDAFSGLKSFLGGNMANLGFLLGTITIFTSFGAIGITLEKVFRYDFKIPRNIAFLLVSSVPLIMFFLGLRDFIGIIGLIGGAMMGMEGILILLMYQKIKPDKKWLATPLAIIFILGVIYEIIYFLA